MTEIIEFTPSEEAIKTLAIFIQKGLFITFSYSADNHTSFIISIGKTAPLQPLPWGGQIQNKYLVALRRMGSEFFDLHSSDIITTDYVAEKLGLQKSDAHQIAYLLDTLRRTIANK